MTQTGNNTTGTIGGVLERFLVILVSKVGGAATLLLIVFYFFYTKGTKEQHEQFIDQYILFKSEDRFGFYLVVVALIVLLIFEMIVFAIKLNAKNGRISDMQQQLEVLQAKLLTKKK